MSFFSPLGEEGDFGDRAFFSIKVFSLFFLFL